MSIQKTIRLCFLFYNIKVVHGIRGFVFDSKTNTPISGVTIHVHGIEHNVTTYRDGDFFRLLSTGEYSITVERTGYVKIDINENYMFGNYIYRYESETKERISVTDLSSTYIEFKLKRKEIDDRPSTIKILYNQSKEFVLHRTLFLIITGVGGSLIDLF